MKPRNPKKAFTLVEMAIVLVIIGLLVGLVAPIVTDLVKREKVTNARDYVEQVKDEIIGFAIINKHLPSSTELGTKVDAYGNTLEYHASSDMQAQDFCSSVPADSTLFTVTEHQPVSGTNVYNGVAFVISSAGRNLLNEYSVVGQDVTTYDPRAWGETSPSTDQAEYDDIVEYVTFNYLKNKVCSSSSSGFTPPGSDTSFGNDPQSYSQDNVTSTTLSGGGSYGTFDADSGTLTLDTGGTSQSDQAFCNFYKGSIANRCTDGLCLLGLGIRAYFKFTVQPSSNGGFTFALIGVNSTEGVNCPGGTGSADTVADCTDTTNLCGGECGYLGYTDRVAAHTGLASPKMAVEFDLYASNGGDYNDQVFSGNTAANGNHITMDLWNAHSTAGDRNDVNHNTSFNLPSGTTYPNPSNRPRTFYDPGSAAWMEDGLPHTVRIEVHRYTGNSTWELYSWYDCGNCTDLSLDYDPGTNPGAYYSAAISTNGTIPNGGPVPLFDTLNYFRFGWTAGICGEQTIDIKDFGLSFR